MAARVPRDRLGSPGRLEPLPGIEEYPELTTTPAPHLEGPHHEHEEQERAGEEVEHPHPPHLPLLTVCQEPFKPLPTILAIKSHLYNCFSDSLIAQVPDTTATLYQPLTSLITNHKLLYRDFLRQNKLN